MRPLNLFLVVPLIAALFASWALAEDAKAPARFRVYIGTATGKTAAGNESQGIYASELDLASGKLTGPVLAAACTGPSFLALHPDGKHLYAVGEMRSAGGKSVGALSAFVIEDAKTGKLKMLNQASSGGPGPCHLVVDKAGKLVLAANYSGGSCCAVAIKEDGSLGEQTSFAQHAGSSVDPSRQREPHAHSINVSPDNRFAFCADLGLDQVLIYKLDGGTLIPNPPFGKTAPGSGPRHFAFHPSGKFAYVINELGNTVTAFAYDKEKGSLTEIQSIGTLPAGYEGKSYTAEVVVHPSGRFLYGSNRGQDSIAVFKVDPESGKLTAASHQGEEVKWPRNFNIDPTGKYCLVCNEKGDSILAWAINQETGALTPTGNKITVGQPMCVKFLKL